MANISSENLDRVNEAFSAQAPFFDDIERRNVLLQWMRGEVHRCMAQYVKTGDSLLDISAGTGIDAVHFAERGYSVTAVDIAEGMVKEMEKKIQRRAMEHTIDIRRCSYTDLSSLQPRKFNYAFSNFGALNCVPDLSVVAEGLLPLLHPGAYVTLVVMPVVCPWEILHAAKGNLSLALRRFHTTGVTAHIEGRYFRTYYHSLAAIKKSFQDHYRFIGVRGLASLSPPPSMEKFPEKFPRTYTALTRLDQMLSSFPPFNRWADHIIVTFQVLSKRL